MSEIELSTMTLDGKISNIKFDKKTAIHDLYTYENIIKIGCNYGVHMSDLYMKEYHKEKPKTNRGRKPKKIETYRKKQGNGSHFNSQITFTIIHPTTKVLYQVKLFTNGRLQIPGIGNIDHANQHTEMIDTIIRSLLEYININGTLKWSQTRSVGLEYLSPILQNYKFRIDLQEDIEFLDLHNLKQVFIELKNERSTSIKIHSIIFHPERYAGLLIKFSTPEPITNSYVLNKFIEMVKLYLFKNDTKKKKTYLQELSPEEQLEHPRMYTSLQMINAYWKENNKVRKKAKSKQTTVKIFKSGKINIDSTNSIEEANQIRMIIIDQIYTKKEQVVYTLPVLSSISKDKIDQDISHGK